MSLLTTTTSSTIRELEYRRVLGNQKIHLTPFKVQNILFEVLKSHLVTNTPQDLGYPLKDVYSPDETKSDIFIDLSNNWKSSATGKRPAVYVYRGDAKYGAGVSTLGKNTIGANVKESEEIRYSMVSLPVNIRCIHGPVGAVETFADYIKHPFLYFAKEIQNEYCFQRLTFVELSKAQLSENGQKEEFYVDITLNVEFMETWMIKRDDLKLKTVEMLYENENQ